MYRIKQMIDIIIITKNNYDELNYTLKSIFDCNALDMHVIIVDGSEKPDSKLQIKFNKSKKISYIVQKDKGIYSAYNIGLNHSSHEFITWINSGDLAICKNLNEAFLRLKNSQKDWIFSGIQWHDAEGQKIEIFHQGKITYKSYIYGLRWIPHPGAIFRRSFISKFNLKYSEKFGYAGDQEFMIKAWILSKPLIQKEASVSMLLGGVSMTSNWRSRFYFWQRIREERRELFLNNRYLDSFLIYPLKIIFNIDYRFSYFVKRRKKLGND